MKVLIIGSGGREDAIAWKLDNEETVTGVFVSPGNAGMLRLKKVELIPTTNTSELVAFCRNNQVGLCICGPEAPLTEGIADDFNNAGIPFFGPTASAAQLEGSKIYSKEFMQRHSIPTANFKVAQSYEEAINLLENWDLKKGIVLKADGLAGGKGVVVTSSFEEAKQTIYDFMKNPDVSVKTDRLLLEEVLVGEEVSCFAICAQEKFFFLGSACDHKRVGDGDTGANTGGMGCFRDRNWPDQTLQQKVIDQVLKPTLRGMSQEANPFVGFLFMGLMIDTQGRPSVIEYNVRMGDPETQTLLPLIKGDFGQALLDIIAGRDIDLSLDDKDSVHVVLTSGGYPSIGKHTMSLGHKVKISQKPDSDSDSMIFYAGVSLDGESLTNSGGRVLGVTTIGPTIKQCREEVYKAVGAIDFQDCHFRQDIAAKKRGPCS